MEQIASRLQAAGHPIWEKDLIREMAQGREDAAVFAGQIHKSLQLNSRDVPRSSRMFVTLAPDAWKQHRLKPIAFKQKITLIPVWKRVPDNLIGLLIMEIVGGPLQPA